MATDPFTYEHGNPTKDACCKRMGWIEYLISNYRGDELHISVPPDADLDEPMHAFWHDEQEMVAVVGYLWDWELIEERAA